MPIVNLDLDQFATVLTLVRGSRDQALLEALTAPQMGVIGRLDAAHELWDRCFSDSMLMANLAPTLTCGEAEVFAYFIESFSDTDRADAFLGWHAHSDEPDDLHYDLRGHD